MRSGGETVSFVVDTNPDCGRGHISRCLLLAEAMCVLGADCKFFLTHALNLPKLHSFRVFLLSEATPKDRAIVIVDGYRFDASFLSELRNFSSRLVLIDDLAECPFPANIVL